MDRHGVDKLVFDGDGGVVLCDLVDDVAPELRGFEHVGFVHAGELFLRAARGEVERDAGDALDFGAGVNHGVVGAVGGSVPGARFAEIEAAEQFADEEDVRALGDLRAQRAVVRERGVGDSGP